MVVKKGYDHHIRGGRTFRISVGTLLIFLILGGGANSLSNNGGGTWQYYRDITINNTGSALTDYQVLVTLDSSNFPTGAQIDGDDIRFEQGGAELNYWFEKWDHVGKSALVWVKVTGVPIGNSVMRMWYGMRTRWR